MLFCDCTRQVKTVELERSLVKENHLLLAQADTIKKYFDPIPNQVQMAIAIIKGDSVNFVGIKRSENVLRFINNKDSVFEIGSVTKVFTAALLAHFVIEGRLHLEDSLSSFFPFRLYKYPKDGKEILLKNLANHTSGLPSMPKSFILHSYIHFNWDTPYKDFDTNKLLNYLKYDCELDFTPGERYQYSNLGFGVLGYILVQQSGKSYEDLLREIIFKPLGMTSSTTIYSNIQSKLVHGIYCNGSPAPNWNMNAMVSAGGIKTSATDLVKFIQSHFVPTDSMFPMICRISHCIDKNNYIGLGWDIQRKQNGVLWFIRPGGTRGYESCVIMDTMNRKAVIVLSNLSSIEEISINVEYICSRLMETL